MKKLSLMLILLAIISCTVLPLYAMDYRIDSHLINNETYYPLYKILNILHLERRYDHYTQKLIIKDNGRYLFFFIDEDTIYYERESILLKSPPIRDNGIIYIPKEMVDLITQWKRGDFQFSYIDRNFKINEKEEVIYKEDVQIAEKETIPVKEETALNSHQKIVTTSPSQIKFIVIDPGHGGKDPGAIGQKALREKTVVLNVSLYLKDYLNDRLKDVKITMTRDEDNFITLNKRANIANQFIKKDSTGIFISVHANASYNKKSRGTETFVLSPVASDDEARAVAAMENGIIESEKSKVEPITKILTGMLSYENIRESIQLAGFIQEGYHRNLKANKRTKEVKKALFYVLEGTLIPAVLTEIGFITNEKEEKLLRSKAYQKKIAKSIGEGIVEFINWHNANNGFIQ
ncbi:MAG: N-acetylmuramoyl-L-alanine amidase [Spirochaetes bacterium]|nr:N-acetylmuramoyl-L-alanine amidase [Spirochaetota bacterium]